MHSATGDVDAIHHDLRNGIRHYFEDHHQYSSTFCKQSAMIEIGVIVWSAITYIYILVHLFVQIH